MITSDFALIATMTATAVTITFLMSKLLAKPVLNHALKKAGPGIQEFRNGRYSDYATTDVGIDQSLEDFRKIIYESDELRLAAIAQAEKMKIPQKGKPQSFNDLKKSMEEMDDGFQGLVRMATNKRTMTLLRDKAALHVMKDGSIIIDNIKATIIMDQMYPPPFVPITGSDLADHTGDMIHETVAEHMAGQVVETLLVPGVLSGAKAVWREAGMLINDETSWDEAWENGLAPALTTTGATIAAYSLDVILCLGIPVFVTCTRLFMGWLNKLSLKDKTNEDWELLKKYLDQIQTRKNSAITKINDVVANDFGSLPEMLKKVPNFRQAGETKSFLDKLEAAYIQDQLVIYWNMSNACDNKIQALPKRTLVDKFFRINRSAEIAVLYQQSYYEMVDQNKFKTKSVINAMKTSPELMGAIFKEKDTLLQNGQTMTMLSRLFRKMPTMMQDYQQSVEDWKANFSNRWQTGMSNLRNISNTEATEVKALEKNLLPYTRPLRDRIRGNLTRMGQDPALCP